MSVEGNKFEVGAVRNLMVLFGHADFDLLMKKLGFLKRDIKAAARVAAQRTQRWAAREGAKGIAQAVGVPYRGMRQRTRIKMRYQSMTGGAFPELRIWFGLNDVPWKFLNPRQNKRGVRSTVGEKPGAFIRMGDHVFVRTGPQRLPIKKVELPINQAGDAYVQSTFSPMAANHFMTEFFAALDRAKGQAEGATESLAAGLREQATRFAK